jgi:hypothetical protein
MSDPVVTRTSGMVDTVLAANLSWLGEVPSVVGAIRIDATVAMPESMRLGSIASGVHTVGDLASVHSALVAAPASGPVGART